MANSIFILKKTSDLPAQQLKLGEHSHIFAESGSVYSLIDAETGLYPEGILLQQEGDDLLLMLDGDVLLVLNEYFNEEKDVSFDQVGHSLAAFDSSEAQQPAEHAPAKPIWSAETDTLVSLDNPDAASKAPETVSADGAVDTSLPNELSSANGDVAGMNPARPAPDQAHDKDLGAEEGVVGKGGLESIGWGWYAGAIGLGVIGAAAGGGGSSSSSNSSSSNSSSSNSSSSNSSSGSGVGAATNSVSISAAAGTFFSIVQIDVYDTDGNLLVSEDHNYSDGDYVYTGTYSGPILVEISDINNDDANPNDYIDETTGEAKSLGTTLRAMMTTDGSADTAVSVTPLTELATQLAGITTENRTVTKESVDVNEKVAKLFNVKDITAKPTIVGEESSETGEDAIAAAKQYGEALAILSGADSESGNTNPADTITTIAESLKQVNEANGDATADLKLPSDVADLLAKGLEAYNNGPTGRDNAITTTFSFSSVPVLVNDAGETIGILNADGIQSSINVKIKGLEEGNTVTLTVGENSVEHVVTAADLTNGYVPITNSWFGDDGNYDVVVTVDTSDSVTTTIRVDTTAPDEPTFALHQVTEESEDDSVTTSDTTIDVTLAADATSWQYSLDGGANWVTRTSGNSFELKGDTTYDAEQIQVKQFDKAGNESPVYSNESAITTLATSAPELGLKEDTGSSASDGITNNTTVKVAFDEGVELASWQYSLDGGDTWSDSLDSSDTSFELTANTTYAADTIQVKQTDTAGNEEIASLSSKVVTDNTAGAPVTFLAKDTGESNKDGVTNDTTYKVNVAKDTVSWEYRLNSDSDDDWVTGEDSSFKLAENTTYDAGAIQVRQTDIAGNVSAVKSNTIEITTDTIAPEAPSFSLDNDTGSEAIDGITNDATVNVILSDDAVSWEYRLSSESDWVTGEGSSFELAENTEYAVGDIQVKQIDVAGNESIGSNHQNITVDTAVDDPTLEFSYTNSLASTRVNVGLEDDVASWEYSLDSGDSWQDGQGERFSLAPETTYNAGEVQVRQTDMAGNVSSTTSNDTLTTDVAIDPPSFELASDTGVSSTDTITSSSVVNVTLLGGEEGAVSWNYSLDGGTSWSENQPITTTSFALADDTTYELGKIQVTQTDSEGNESAYATNQTVFVIDSTAAAPMFSFNDTGVLDDNITNDSTITVELADDVNSWQYSLDGGTNWIVGEGTSFTLAEDKTYAAGQIQIKQTDLAGNESPVYQNPDDITLDTTPLDAPSLSLSSDTGISDTDGITQDATMNVTLFDDAVSWEYRLNAESEWVTGEGSSFELAENAGYSVDSIQVRQYDAAGNVSESVSNQVDIRTDNTAEAPTFSLQSDSGSSDEDGITNKLKIFTSPAGDVVDNLDGTSTISQWALEEYSLDNGETWKTTEGGLFSLESNQTYTVGMIRARQTDAAGNVSEEGFNQAVITTDTIIPETPILDLATDSGLASDGITNVTTINVSLLENTATWSYSLKGGEWLTGEGSSFELAENTEYAVGDIQVKHIDVAGNESIGSNQQKITVDTVVDDPTLEFSYTNSLASTRVNVGLEGDVASWEYSLNNGEWQEGQGASFSLAPKTTYEAGAIQVRQTDLAGNVSSITSNDTLTTDVAIDPPSFELASDTGQSNVDFITSSTTVTVSSLEGAEFWNYSVDGGGSWSDDQSVETTSFELEDGVYAIGTILVTQTDADGNESTYANNPTKITIDTNIDSPAFNITDTGAFNSDGVTNELNVDVDLAIDVASWQFSLNGGQTWQSGSGGSFTLSANESYEEGQIQVKQTDIAGNESLVVMNTNEITTDISLLSSPVFGLNDDTGENKTDGISKDATVLVEMSEDVYIWQYSLDSGSTWSGEQSPEVESFELNGNTIYQAGQIQVRQIDLAGNVSTSSNPNIITIDTTMLSEPTITLNDDTGFNDSDSITQDSTINVELAEDAVSWTFSTDAGETWSGSQDISVTSFELGENSYYGSSGIQVKQFDAAGNESDPTVLSYVQTDTEVETPILELTITGANGTHTSELEVSVGLVNDVSTWRYSLDGGSNWQEGNGTSFTLEDSSTYAAGDIKVEQTDTAGNISDYAVVDQAVITNTSLPSIPQLNFSYSSDSDYITSDTTVTVTLDENVASWRYSTDAGLSWSEGIGNSFELESGQYIYYKKGDLLVEQTDLAGNVSSQGQNESYIYMDTIAPKPTFEMVEDTGVNDADGITSNITVNFTYINEWFPDSWQYSLDGGETWSELQIDNNSPNSFALESNKFYEVGEIQVRQTDQAGNLSLAYSNEIEITTDTLAPVAPSFALHNDTGDSDSDYITSDTTIDVTSIESGASWQYSLDGGETWIEGSGTSFEMGALLTYEINQIQVRQIDVAGNISAVASNDVVFVSDSLPAPIVTLAEDSGVSDSDNVTNVMTVNVGLDANATSWQYSLDAGGNWEVGEESSFELAENTTYETGQIQVKQFDESDNESASFSNDEPITTDTIVPLESDIYVSTENTMKVYLGEQYDDVEMHSVGNKGEFIVTWINDNDDLDTKVLNVQRFDSEGGASNLPYIIEVDDSLSRFYIEDVIEIGESGAFAITWYGYASSDVDNLNFQLFDENGSPIGSVQESSATSEWVWDSEIIGLDSSNQYASIWTKDVGEGVEAYIQLIDATTGEAGVTLSFEGGVEPFVGEIGSSGDFLVVWNDVQSFDDASAIVRAQKYTSSGTKIGSEIVLNPDAGEYAEDVFLIGTDGAFTAVMVDEDDMTVSLQTVDASGSLSERVELSGFTDDADLDTVASILNANNDFAVSWMGKNAEGEAAVYTQSFDAAGTALMDAVTLPFEFEEGEEYYVYLDTVSSGTGDGYFISVDYDVETEDDDSFVGSGVYFVNGDSLTEIVVNEDNDDWSYFDVQVLNDDGDILIFKEGQDIASDENTSYETDSWIQLYNGDGTPKSEQFEFSGNVYDLDWTLLNSDGDFLVSWVQYDGYLNEESQWVNDVTNHVQVFSAEGELITPTEIEPGDELPISVADEGMAYLVAANVSVTSIAEIVELDESTWSSVAVGADTDHLLETEGLSEGNYYLYVSDLAGNLTQYGKLVTLSEAVELLEEPDVDLNADTGWSDEDGITNDTLVNVKLTDGATRWEYSLDHGVTWIERDLESNSFKLTENTEFNLNDIQVRQYDEEGNVSEVASNSDSYLVIDNQVSVPEIEIAGTTVRVTLDDDWHEWDYSLDGGDTILTSNTDSFQLEPGTTYEAGSIIVWQEDRAGNESESEPNQIYTTPAPYQAPTFELFEDTGISDSDGITNEGSLNVFLTKGTSTSNDAVAFEYSLDGSENWQFGSGAYVLLGDDEFAISDFKAYQYDADGNESDLTLDYGDDEYVDFAIGFEVLESTVRWKYSIDNGETFTSVNWADVDGHFIDLDYDEEYAIGDIQVRQINAEGEISLVAKNEQVIIVDEDAPYDLTVSPSYTKLEGTDTSLGSFDLQSTKSETLGDSGLFTLSWVVQNYIEGESTTEAFVQVIDSDGNAVSEKIAITPTTEDVRIPAIEMIALGNTGSFIVTWWEQNDDVTEKNHFYQVYDADGAVTSPVGIEGEYYEEFISSVNDNGNFVLSYYSDIGDEQHTKSALFDVNGDKITDLLDIEYSYSLAETLSVGSEGNFVVLQNNTLALFDEVGVAINSTTLSSWSPELLTLGTSGGYGALYTGDVYYESFGEYINSIVIDRFDESGTSLEEVALVTLGDGGYADILSATASDNGGFAVSWSNNSQTYLQAFDADGASFSEAVVIVPASDLGTVNAWGVSIESIEYNSSYIVTGEYNVQNNETNYYSGTVYFARLIDSDGAMTTIYESDSYSNYKVAVVGDNGAFVVTWEESDEYGQDLMVQVHNADGTVSDVVPLEASQYSHDHNGFIIELDNGEFAVSWTGDVYYSQDNKTSNVYIQKFNADGTIVDKTIIDGTGEVSVESPEDGIAYLVNSTLFEDSSSIDFFDDYDQWDDVYYDSLIDETDDSSQWNSVEVTGGEEAFISAEGLDAGSYYVLMADTAGNVYLSDVGITVNQAVTFDLISGESTDLDSQTFDADETYNIYINIGNGLDLSLDFGGQWSGADNLGEDDTIILVSDESVTSFSAEEGISWQFDGEEEASLTSEGVFTIASETVDLWSDNFSATPEVMAQVTPEPSDV